MSCEELKSPLIDSGFSEWLVDDSLEPDTVWFKKEKEISTSWMVPVKRCTSETRKTSLAFKFEALSRTWKAETALTSSTQEVVLNSSYQRIIAMGKPAIPLILKDLKQEGGRWFWALRILCECNPVQEQFLGNYEKMRSTWLAWGRSNHYI